MQKSVQLYELLIKLIRSTGIICSVSFVSVAQFINTLRPYPLCRFQFRRRPLRIHSANLDSVRLHSGTFHPFIRLRPFPFPSVFIFVRFRILLEFISVRLRKCKYSSPSVSVRSLSTSTCIRNLFTRTYSERTTDGKNSGEL